MSSITPQERINRFWSNVDIRDNNECWEWKGYKNADGYGQTGMGFGTRLSNRVAWIITKGSIPKGLEVLHSCDNPSCCNPRHLFLGTQNDNMKDMAIKRRGKNARTIGEDAPRAKLKEEDVLEILKLCQQGVNHNVISKRFNIGHSTVSMISTGRSWLHLHRK